MDIIINKMVREGSIKKAIRNGKDGIVLMNRTKEINNNIIDNTIIIMNKAISKGECSNFDDYYKHITSLTNKVNVDEIKNKVEYIDLLDKLADYEMNMIGDTIKSLRIREEIIAIKIKYFSKDQLLIAEELNILGNSYFEILYCIKSIEFNQKALEIYKKLNNDIGIADTLNALGLAYDDLNKHDDAIGCFEKSLEIKYKILPRYHLSIGDGLKNIGIAHLHTKKANNEAINYLEKALNIFRYNLPRNHISIAELMNNLGGAYFKNDENWKAIEYFDQSFQIKEKILPTNHPSLVNTLNNLNTAYSILKKQYKQIKRLSNSLEILKTQFNENHPAVKSTRNQLFRSLYKVLNNNRRVFDNCIMEDFQKQNIESLMEKFNEQFEELMQGFSD